MRTAMDILLAEDSDEDAVLALRALRRAAPQLRVLRVKDGDQALQCWRYASARPARLADAKNRWAANVRRDTRAEHLLPGELDQLNDGFSKEPILFALPSALCACPLKAGPV